MLILEKIHSLQARLDFYKKLYDELPDLEEIKGRWEATYLVSKSVNPRCHKFSMKNSCGCCRDSALVVTFSADINQVAVFSDPPEFVIALRDNGVATPVENWKENLQKHNLPQSLIDAVERRLQQHMKKKEIPDEQIL